MDGRWGRLIRADTAESGAVGGDRFWEEEEC